MKFIKIICITLGLSSFAVTADEDHVLAAFALKNATFTQQQAIEKVSANYTGQITEFELDDHNNQAVYEIEIINLKKDEKYKVKLSLINGTILKEKKSSLSSLLGRMRLDNDELLALQQLQASDFNLQQTIKELTTKQNGQLIEFELENEKGITFYKMKLVNEQGIQRILVDIKSGDMIPVVKKH